MAAMTTLLLLPAVPSLAVTPSEFYVNLLRRGTADVEAGEFARATGPLRIAAFGLVDSIEHYQTAEVYLAIAWDKLSKPDNARDAARRVIAAQRIERRYAALTIPARIRSDFDRLAATALSADEVAELQPRRSAPPRTTDTTTPSKPAPAQEAAPVPQRPAPVTETRAATEQPASQATASKPEPSPARPQQTAAQPPPDEKKLPVREKASQPATTEKTEAKSAPAQTPSVRQTAEKPAATPPAASKPAAASKSEIQSRLTAAEAALEAARLPDARRAFNEVLAETDLDHESLIRITEGLYRARDFKSALSAFGRLGPLRKGEEPYHYYAAVAYFETGQFEKAKAEFAAALPFIEITDDVAAYRAKIQSATP